MDKPDKVPGTKTPAKPDMDPGREMPDTDSPDVNPTNPDRDDDYDRPAPRRTPARGPLFPAD